MIKRIFLILILCGIAFFIFVISTFDEGYLKNRIEAIEAEKANNYLTRLGIGRKIYQRLYNLFCDITQIIVHKRIKSYIYKPK